MAMDNQDHPASGYEFAALTPECWLDFERLFGRGGAYGGCWCMWWFEPGGEFERMKGEPNRLAMKGLVEAGATPGILAYRDGEPVGWCAFAPRENYPRLQSSRLLKPLDDQRVWSVVCFYVARPERRKGLTTALLLAVIEAVRERGGRIVEGYPNLPKEGGHGDPFVYTGMLSSFLRAGFVEMARPSQRKAIVRYIIPESGETAGG